MALNDSIHATIKQEEDMRHLNSEKKNYEYIFCLSFPLTRPHLWHFQTNNGGVREDHSHAGLPAKVPEHGPRGSQAKPGYPRDGIFGCYPEVREDQEDRRGI